MKKATSTIIIIIALLTTATAQPIKVYDFKGFQKEFLNRNDSSTYVINFWATWCGPCIKELPAFEKINQNYKAKGVKVILVSLDFEHHLKRKVIPFVKSRNLLSEVIVLDDPDANSWINAISQEWSGAIPATLIYNKTNKEFYEQSFTYRELEDIIKLKFLKL